MSKVLPIVLLLFSFSIEVVKGQSDVAPLKLALDTAKGEARVKVLKRLATALPYRDPESCIQYVDEGISLSRQIFNDKTAALSQIQILLGYKSTALMNLDDEEKTLEVLNQMHLNADTMCANIDGACESRARVFSYIGGYYFKMKDHDKAVINHRKSLEITRAIKGNTIPNLMNLGMSHEHAGHPDSAIYYKKLGKNKLKEVGASQQYLTKADFEIALAYKAAERNDSAVALINQVIDTCSKFDYSLYRKAQMVGAEINNQAGHFERSWSLLQDCRSTILKTNNLEDIAQWYHQSAISTKGLNMLDSALYFTERHVLLHDSLYEVSRDKSIANVEKSMEIKSKESEIKGLTSRLGSQKNWIYFLSVLLIAALGAFYVSNQKAKQQQQQNTLEIRYFLSGKSEINSELEIDPFLEQVLETINKNLGDPNFNVEALASKMHTSRSNLFKKLKPLSGKSPLALIREMRMEKAKLLLETENYSVAEVAEKVGFEDKSYFSKVFKQFFGVSPSNAT